jgi:N-methylhydantoinase A
MTRSGPVIGIDVGGTFTDAVVLDAAEGRLLQAFKLPSTPDDPARAVIEALERIADGIDLRDAAVCHGTTVGTNALIERRGAATALIATEGFADVIELRRQARPALYDFNVVVSPPLVPAERRFEARERVGPGGEVVRPLAAMDGIAERLKAAGVQAVAVSLLHAYANDAHEAAIERLLRDALPDVFVTRSSDVCPEFREYERTSTTVVNAYIGPAVSRYMARLDEALRARGAGRLMIVKSNGGLTSPANAARYPVHLIESGPAAGMTAAAWYGRATGRPDLIVFDMGGTTAKAGVVQGGEPRAAGEFYADRLRDGRDVGGFAIRSPILELVEIGAGGGSLAWIDEAGVLKVGPQSAGAVPGPACYGRGGEHPTVTDAHAVIGTLSAEAFAGSGIRFDRDRAIEALRRHLAEPMGWSLARAAYAIIDIAVANMTEMVRLATIQRGIDPRSHALIASGGAGPLHAAAVGQEIGAREVIVPPHPGMFSALGATLGAIRHEFVRSLLVPLRALEAGRIAAGFRDLRDRAEELLRSEPAGIAPPRFERSLEARFLGQIFELPLPLGEDAPGEPAPGDIDAAFRAAYRAEYGFDLPEAAVEIVNLRLVAVLELGTQAGALLASEQVARPLHPIRRARLLTRDGGTLEIPVFQAGAGEIEGPAIMEHSGSTVWIHAGQRARCAANGQLVLRLAGASP